MHENPRKIALLGCGWLGLPLAKGLVSKGFDVSASTTTPGKMQLFRESGIDPYLVQFSEGADPDISALMTSGTLIITIPPGRRDPAGFSNYRSMIDAVCQKVPGSAVKKLIFMSSTSVYPDSCSLITEGSPALPSTGSGLLLRESEQRLAAMDVDLVILRLAGLIGPDRMPGHFFAGKQNIPGGLSPVNLVHRDDVIGFINKLLVSDMKGIYNVSAGSHPTRQEFYTKAARCHGLPEPVFIAEKLPWKIIDNKRSRTDLNFTYQTDDLLAWLDGLCT